MKVKKDIKNKKVFKIIGLVGILLITSLFITGTLSLGSLYGGDSENKYGGNFSTTGTGLSGDTTTSFAECDISQIDISLTNNANSPFTLTGQPAYKIAEVQITSTGTDTDYQVKIPVTSLTGMNSDLSNVRFQTANGAELDQWRESYVADTSADYWIKTDLVTGSNSVYMVYGGTLPLKSDGEDVFEFFDDFDRADSTTEGNGWTGDTSYFSIEDGKLKLTSINAGRGLTQDLSIDDYALHFSAMSESMNEISWYVRYGSYGYQTRITSSYVETRNSNGWSQFDSQAGSYSADTWYDIKTKVIGDDISVSVDDDEKYSFTSSTYLTGDISIGGKPVSDNVPLWFDDVYVTKVMATEPTIAIQTPSDISYDYEKMQILTIDNSAGGALSGYQHLETVTYDSDMQPDFSDLIFTETDGTVLSHYIESYTASTEADVFIKIDADATSSKNINMYYGNAEIVDLSDMNSVFNSFFDGDSIGWTKVDPNGRFAFTNDRIEFTSLSCDEAAYVYEHNPIIDGLNTISEYTIAITGYSDGAGIYTGFGGGIGEWNSQTTGYVSLIFSPFQDITRSQIKGGNNGVGYTTATTTYYVTLIRDGTTVTQKLYSDSAHTNLLHTSIATHTSIGTTEYVYLAQSWDYDNTKWISGWIDDFSVRQYVATPPTISFGSEKTLVNPTIAISATGDSDSQQYGLETKDVILNPTAAISSFDIAGSLDYDFDATMTYSGDTTVTEQNSTTGEITFTFTPDVNITSGYANAVFSETVNITNPQIIATLDGETIDAVFENDTVSVQLTNCNNTLHTVMATISEQIEETPTVPSSGGGGGSTYVPPIVEESEEIENNSTISNNVIDETQNKVNPYINDTETIIFIIIFGLFGIFGYLYFKK